MTVIQMHRNEMTEADYDRQRAELRDTYGDGTSKQMTARYDQELAKLFDRSGWTQEQLAAKEGKKQPYVSRRLQFGRFLAIMPNGIILSDDFSEGRFRSYWDATASLKGNNTIRFAAVAEMVRTGQEPPKKRAGGTQLPPLTEEHVEEIKTLREAGGTRHTIAETLGITESAARADIHRAEAFEQGYALGKEEAAVLPALATTAKAAFEAHCRRFEKSFEARVYAAYSREIDERYKPAIDRELAEAAQVVKARRGVMPRAMYRKIMACLHPDNSMGVEVRREAFEFFGGLELVLVSEKEMPTNMPTTVNELLARRRAKERKK